MKKQVTALALAAASFGAQDAFATVAAFSVVQGTQIQIGCTAPSATGATVYSIDANAINALGSQDVIALPSGVTTGANCSYALNQIAAVTSLAGGAATGRWVASGVVPNTNANPIGASAVNVTIPGSGYSLVTYTFVAQ